MYDAYVISMGTGRVRLDLTGVERIGKQETPFSLRSDWMMGLDASGNPGAWLDLTLTQNGALVQRFVGDGVTLWNHRLGRNEYSGYTYGNPDGPAAAGFIGRLLKGLQQQSRGVAVWPSRLLTDLFTPAQAGTWRPWMPSAALTVEGDVVSEAIDKTYRVDYVLVRPTKEAPEQLDEVRFFETTPFGGDFRTVLWTLKVGPGPIPDDADFTFMPSPGARALGTQIGAPKVP